MFMPIFFNPTLLQTNEKITTLGSEWEKAREKLVAREEDLAFQLEVFSSNEDGILHLSQV